MPVTPFPQGFTDFAKAHVAHTETGPLTVIDQQSRVYVIGGNERTGERTRTSVRAPFPIVWPTYRDDIHANLLWVKWSDGRRHLVHRKAR